MAEAPLSAPEIVPNPDPSYRTTEQLLREVQWLKEFASNRDALVVARIDAMDKAIVLLQAFADKSPTTSNVAGEVRALKDLFDAETRRLDQIAGTTQSFQNTIRDMLAESVKSTSSLVSTQLVQIQATFDTRVTKLEAYQLTQAGRSSVSDPVMENALRMITNNIAEINTKQDAALASFTKAISAMQSSESLSGGKDLGHQAANARLFAILTGVAAIAGPIIAIIALRGH